MMTVAEQDYMEDLHTGEPPHCPAALYTPLQTAGFCAAAACAALAAAAAGMLLGAW